MNMVQVGVISIRNSKGEFSPPVALYIPEEFVAKIGVSKEQEKAFCEIAKSLCVKLSEHESQTEMLVACIFEQQTQADKIAVV